VALPARARYQGRIAKSEQAWNKHSEVLADHSTDVHKSNCEREGGEVRPKRPTAGKVKPGITFLW
jgi:hypothetical protein